MIWCSPSDAARTPRSFVTGITLFWLALLLPAGATLTGCGYNQGLAPKLPSGEQTESIGIEIFGNETYFPNVERDLHAAMSASAISYVDASLVRPESARFVIRGRIRNMRRQPGIRSGQNRVLETRLVLIVEALLHDRVTGEVLNETTALARVGYTLEAPGMEAAARVRSLRLAADRVVLSLLAGAEYGAPELESLGDPARVLDDDSEAE